ncbi:MAG: energy transducer TonB [bacterium]|nr:energy transducer TonB [bacterium]
MEVKLDYHKQSMDEIVFDARNKNYGAYVLRQLYEKHLLKALGISVFVFVFTMFSPKIVKNLGLFAAAEEEQTDTTVLTLVAPPSIKPDEPPPPPPPPVEPVLRPTARFMEMEAVKKEEVDEPPPPTIIELENKDIGKENIKAEITDEPPPIIVQVTGGTGVDKNKIYEKVEQYPAYIGGQPAIDDFLADNLVYPPDDYDNGVTGLVVVYFVVTETGQVTDVRVGKSSRHPKLDAAAVNVVKKLSKFKPGKQNGEAVKVRCEIPIEFAIE